MWPCWNSWQNSPTSLKFSFMMPQLRAQCLGRSRRGCILPLFSPGLSPLLTTAPRDSQTTSWDSVTSEKLQREGTGGLFILSMDAGSGIAFKGRVRQLSHGLNLDAVSSHPITLSPLAEQASCRAAGQHLPWHIPWHVRTSDPEPLEKGLVQLLQQVLTEQRAKPWQGRGCSLLWQLHLNISKCWHKGWVSKANQVTLLMSCFCCLSAAENKQKLSASVTSAAHVL